MQRKLTQAQKLIADLRRSLAALERVLPRRFAVRRMQAAARKEAA